MELNLEALQTRERQNYAKEAKEYGADHVTTGDQHRKYVKLKRGVLPELKMKNWRENINLDFFSDLQKLVKLYYII